MVMNLLLCIVFNWCNAMYNVKLFSNLEFLTNAVKHVLNSLLFCKIKVNVWKTLALYTTKLIMKKRLKVAECIN